MPSRYIAISNVAGRVLFWKIMAESGLVVAIFINTPHATVRETFVSLPEFSAS
jgi:hypothetical protein